jgi:hypothetical protein
VDQPIYHVLLEGRKVGPYDRRTIVGMRIKKTLSSDHVLIGTDGTQLTVSDLIGAGADKAFQPDRTSNSLVQASYTASLISVAGKGQDIPPFKGEVEVRVQGEVLRIAGRCKRGFQWKDERVKLALKDVLHARISGSQVDLWLKSASQPTAPFQRMSLELFSHAAAGELVEWLPAATPLPSQADAAQPDLAGHNRKLLWMLASSAALSAVIFVVILVALSRRMY